MVQHYSLLVERIPVMAEQLVCARAVPRGVRMLNHVEYILIAGFDGRAGDWVSQITIVRNACILKLGLRNTFAQWQIHEGCHWRDLDQQLDRRVWM